MSFSPLSALEQIKETGAGPGLVSDLIEVEPWSENVVAPLIISGGQSGVDRAALDFARERGIPYGGWCPAGGLAEDFPDPPGLLAAYPALRETESRDYRVRTRRNILDSSATLVICPAGNLSRGTALTIRLAEKTGKPCLRVEPDSEDDLIRAQDFLLSLPADGALNVAGPRASGCEGIYDKSLEFLRAIWT